jgi:hypothetical protein
VRQNELAGFEVGKGLTEIFAALRSERSALARSSIACEIVFRLPPVGSGMKQSSVIIPSTYRMDDHTMEPKAIMTSTEQNSQMGVMECGADQRGEEAG